MPVNLRENVEETIQDGSVGESKCAIVRYVDNDNGCKELKHCVFYQCQNFIANMDTIYRVEKLLPAYNLEELEANGNPIACFTVYIGTDGSNVEYDVRMTETAQRNVHYPY